MKTLSTFSVLIYFVVIDSTFASMFFHPIWVQWSSARGGIPVDAVVGGTDVDGNDLYVIKALTEYGIITGKYNKEKLYGYVSHGEKEIQVMEFAVRPKFWVNSRLT